MNASKNARKKDDLIDTYEKMYQHTKAECAACPAPHSCCDAIYCRAAIEWAKDTYGITLEPTKHPDLPLMGEHGCTAAPHLRPLCTVHTCSVSSLGFKKGDTEWTQRYYELRDELDQLESFRFARIQT